MLDAATSCSFLVLRDQAPRFVARAVGGLRSFMDKFTNCDRTFNHTPQDGALSWSWYHPSRHLDNLLALESLCKGKAGQGVNLESLIQRFEDRLVHKQ